jgi:hypothetical protein
MSLQAIKKTTTMSAASASASLSRSTSPLNEDNIETNWDEKIEEFETLDVLR